MGVRLGSSSSNTILGSPIVTTAETVIFTTPPVNLVQDNALILVFWEAVITLTAGTTACTFRLRRGTTTAGALVNVAQAITVTASTTIKFSGVYQDTPGIVAAQQYSLSATMTAAAANSTVNDGCIAAVVL